jgi:electron transfer flavoprotein alpha subunit
VNASAVAIVPVRAGVLPLGGIETVAEVVALGEHRVILVGSGLGSAAGDLAGHCERVDLAELGDYAVSAWAAALAPEVERASVVVLPGSPDGRDLAVRLAATLGWALVPGAMSVSFDEVVVPHHGGQVQSVMRPSMPFVATVQPGVRGVEGADGDLISTVDLDLVAPAGAAAPADVTIVEIEPADAATIDLAEAPRIVGGGAGLMSGNAADRFSQLTDVGAALGAAMGATRVVTDAGFVSHSRQIGTTGVVVDPELYIAFGVSGAVQHTAGLGSPDHIISVNTDPHCPMMAMADLAVVADAVGTLEALALMLDLDRTQPVEPVESVVLDG